MTHRDVIAHFDIVPDVGYLELVQVFADLLDALRPKVIARCIAHESCGRVEDNAADGVTGHKCPVIRVAVVPLQPERTSFMPLQPGKASVGFATPLMQPDQASARPSSPL